MPAFRCVLIDEAAQATEAACLVPLVKGCASLVMCGDHHQLVSDPAPQLLLDSMRLRVSVRTHADDCQPGRGSYQSCVYTDVCTMLCVQLAKAWMMVVVAASHRVVAYR